MAGYRNRQARARAAFIAKGGATPTPTPTPTPGPNLRYPLSIVWAPGTANLAQAYSYTPETAGGSGAKTYSLSGTLPAGLSFSSATGAITGTPTAAGSFGPLTMTVSDASGTALSDPMTFIVGVAPVAIAPSGDTSGATDTSAIQAALDAGRSVNLSAAIYNINAILLMPSATAIYGQGSASTEIRLAANSNCQLVANKNRDTTTRTDNGLVISGVFLNGQEGAQTRQTQQRLNHGVCLVSANNVLMKDVKINANASCMSIHGTTNFHARDLIYAQLGTVLGDGTNQDGFDAGNGCLNVALSNVSGSVYDDPISLWAKSAQSSSAMMAGLPWQAGADCYNHIYKDVNVNSNRTNMIRLQAGNTRKFYRVYGKNLNNLAASSTGPRTLLSFGPSVYLSPAFGPSPIKPQVGDLRDIVIEGASGVEYYVSLATTCSNVAIYDIVQNIPLKSALFITSDQNTDFAAMMDNIKVSGVTDTYAGNGTHGDLVNLPSASTPSNITIENVSLNHLTNVVNGTATIANLVLNNIAVKQAFGPLFNGVPASTGTADNISITWPFTSTFAVATGLTLGQNMPTVRAADTIPTPRNGSFIRVHNGVAPANDNATQGGLYVGNGAAWARSGPAQDLPEPSSYVGTLLSDTFTDTDGKALSAHAPEVGSIWYAHPNLASQANGYKIIGGRAYSADASDFFINKILPLSKAGYQEAVYDNLSDIAAESPGIAVLTSTTAQSCYFFRWNQTTASWQLFRINAGASTQLGANVAGTWAVGTAKTLRLDYTIASDNSSVTLVASVDGTPVITQTDTSASRITTIGRVGIRNSGAAQSPTTGKQVTSAIAVSR
ncbi:Ig domain-containing protein [uncultured Novosphingobium sp.]|uniref:Ig domain-containing protein n=1 Tax=uncultured Novosphingobium sp. TaxID=292277 RepID=UPI00374A001D